MLASRCHAQQQLHRPAVLVASGARGTLAPRPIRTFRGLSRSNGGYQAQTATADPATTTASADSSYEDADGGSAPQTLAPGSMRLRVGACCLPHPEKFHYGGEDAFFVSSAGGGAFGVADGVGGWAEVGIDAGAYARLLMSNAKEEAEAAISSGGGALSPQAVLERAYYRTNVQGSSTVCVLALNGPPFFFLFPIHMYFYLLFLIETILSSTHISDRISYLDWVEDSFK